MGQKNTKYLHKARFPKAMRKVRAKYIEGELSAMSTLSPRLVSIIIVDFREEIFNDKFKLFGIVAWMALALPADGADL